MSHVFKVAATLQVDAEQFRDRLQPFVELTMAETSVVAAPDLQPAAPEPSAAVPVELGGSARQRLEEDADEAARAMILAVELMRQRRQPTATSLALALRTAREVSLDFESPQTMHAILRALDLMGAAAREATSHG
jgi:hypothetical protein